MVQGFGLRQPEAYLDILGLDLIHCLPERLGVLDALEVGDHAPGALMKILDLLERLDQAGPCGLNALFKGRDVPELLDCWSLRLFDIDNVDCVYSVNPNTQYPQIPVMPHLCS